jgi:hypothetical protein
MVMKPIDPRVATKESIMHEIAKIIYIPESELTDDTMPCGLLLQGIHEFLRKLP